MKYLIPFSFFLFILQIPPALNGPIVVLTYAAIILTIVLCVQFVGVNKIYESLKTNKWVLLYAVFMSISLLRSGHPTATLFSSSFKVLQIWLFIVYAITISVYVSKWSINKSVLFVLILPNVSLAIANILLTSAGYSFFPKPIEDLQFHNTAIVLSAFGIEMERIQYALARGFGVYSSYTGLMAIMAFVLMLYSRKDKVLLALSTTIFYVILLTIDSRIAILYPIFISLLLLIQRSTGMRTIRPGFFISLSLVGPLLYFFLVPFISSIGALDLIARSDNDIQTGNSRFIIWAYSIEEFISIKVNHIFGYGDYGHFVSGASVSYSNLFTVFNDSYLKTPHNSFLSVLFDNGYVGLLVYLIMFFALAKMTFKHRKKQPLVYQLGSCVIIYHFLCSITETLSGYYHVNYYYMLSLIIILLQTKIYESSKNN